MSRLCCYSAISQLHSTEKYRAPEQPVISREFLKFTDNEVFFILKKAYQYIHGNILTHVCC